MNCRLSRLSAAVLSMGALAVASLGVSCTDSSGYGLTGGGGTGTTTTVTTTSTGGGGVGGFGTGGGACENTCSNDLKKVINCYGETVKECTSEQGCNNAGCIDDPCLAAELSKSSYGCDYWALKTGLLNEAKGACFAAFVANTWSTPVKINVEYDGQSLPVDFAYIPKGQGAGITYEPYDEAVGLGIGEVAILFLARNQFGFVIDCPQPAAISDEVGVTGTGRGKAFHITTDKPVVAYQILPYGGGPSAFSSATLLLPTSAWDTNYIAINAYKNGTIDPEASPLIDILAEQNDTTVTILPNVNIVAGPGVEAGTANVAKEYVLQKGEFLQIEQPEELTGSPIQSDKPVGLWGGSSCLYIPLDKNSCDSAQQQIAPVKALGSEYAAVRYRGRMGMDESIPWRIVGAVDKTELTWDSAPPEGVPEEIGLGTVVEFTSKGPFVVKSQDSAHPFHLSAYMTGGELFDSEGDPDWVNVVPPQQYLDHYVLFTDPTYSETNLVVVRTRSKIDGTFADVTLDCLGGPLTDWKPVGEHEYTRVDLVTGNFQDVGDCSNGRHEMASTLPFGVTVWGWGSKAAAGVGTKLVSYAYPAGASVQPINDVVVLPDPK